MPRKIHQTNSKHNFLVNKTCRNICYSRKNRRIVGRQNYLEGGSGLRRSDAKSSNSSEACPCCFYDRNCKRSLSMISVYGTLPGQNSYANRMLDIVMQVLWHCSPGCQKVEWD